MRARDLPGGWIYIFLTSNDYTRCKIGRTTGNPFARYSNGRTYDPGLGFHVAFFMPEIFGCVSAVEAHIKKELRSVQLRTDENGDTEWFRMDYAHAEELVGAMLEDWCGSKAYYFGTLHPEKLCKLYGGDIEEYFQLVARYDGSLIWPSAL